MKLRTYFRIRIKNDYGKAFLRFWSVISILAFALSATTGGLVHQFWPHTSGFPGVGFRQLVYSVYQTNVETGLKNASWLAHLLEDSNYYPCTVEQ